MKFQERPTAFQAVVLEIIRNKLNMMLSEIFQLKDAVDFSDYSKLTVLVLREIANDSIRSCHMSGQDAKKAIALLECLQVNRVTNPVMDAGGSIRSGNPFADSPFK